MVVSSVQPSQPSSTSTDSVADQSWHWELLPWLFAISPSPSSLRRMNINGQRTRLLVGLLLPWSGSSSSILDGLGKYLLSSMICRFRTSETDTLQIRSKAPELTRASRGPCAWILVAEVWPLSARPYGIALGASSNWMNNFIVGQVTPDMITHLKYGTFILFGVLISMGAAFIWFFVPETKR